MTPNGAPLTPIESVAPEVAVLWVGVHHDAGSLVDLAADGASGQCSSAETWIRCPAANGPVTFRWGPAQSGDWTLYEGRADGGFTQTDAIVVEPGHGGTAVVLPAEAARAGELARLTPDAVTPATLRDLFVRTGDHAVSPPSPGMLGAAARLVDHPDPLVRRELPDVVLPWLRHTALDPLPMGSPSVIPSGTLLALAHDRDPGVRRRLASRLRDVRDGPRFSAEVSQALEYLVATGGSAERASMVAMGSRSKEGSAPAIDAWRLARVRMREPGPAGRAAVKTLGVLASAVDAGGEVDPEAAIRDCLTWHPERTWSLWMAWRRDVPIEPELVLRLFRETIGWSPGLLTWWAKNRPDELEAVFLAWEAGPPHTPRYRDLLKGVALLPDPRWAALLDDKLSPPPQAPPTP